MFRNYLKTAYRVLTGNRLVSFINIFGLGLSMSVAMMVLVIAQDQLSYDRFHPNPDRTYRVISGYKAKNGSQWKFASTPVPLYQTLKADTAAIEEVVNLYPAFNGEVRLGAKELSLNGAFTEPSFFKVFGFTLAAGNPATALQLPNTMVITPATAEKFFGTADPIGKVISMRKGGSFVVTGVLNKASGKSHIDFDVYVSAASIPQMVKNKELPDKSNDWSDFKAAYTYVLLKKGVGEKVLAGQLNAVVADYNREDRDGQSSLVGQPIEKVRPADDKIYNDIGGGNTWTKLWVSIDVALIILLAACFNYTNLTIARALTRAKEVGVRKISGAQRYQLFAQYIVESCVLALCALAFAWVLLSFIIRYAPFNDGYEMVPSSFRYNTAYVLYTIGFALFTGVLAGVAPAWILSSFTPLRVLKNLTTAKIFGKVGLQKSLIVFQYSLSLVIIIFLFTFFRQFSLLASEDPGFKKENTLVLPLDGVDEQIASREIAGISGVHSVSAISASFNAHFSGLRGPGWIDRQQKDAVSMNYFFADPSFIPSMKLPLLAGRNFQPGPDSAAERNIMLNVQATKRLGFKSYEEALGRKFYINDSTALTITGIVGDFKYENAGRPIDPVAFRSKKDAYSYLFIGVDSSDKSSVTARIGQVWKTLAPSRAFTASWLDEDLEKNNSQKATISLLGYLAFMAVSIASLGLLGLVIYTVEIKRKEIGIRKVLGAEKKQVVGMLSKGFVRLLFIAGFIAVPIGYVMSYFFLQNFTTRVGNGFSGALLCFVFLLGIGLITIVSQTYKASAENPVKSLRTE